MKIILLMVTSVDGKSTKGNLGPRSWASKEDQEYFFNTIKENDLMVMGRGTYEGVKSNMKLSLKMLKIVLTKNSKKFEKQSVKGQLEFSSESPKQLVKRLETLGFSKMLLVSGEKINSAFFKDKLIDEVWLTLEPKIFGQGKGIIDKSMEVNLKLKSVEKLNTEGTLLLKYYVS